MIPIKCSGDLDGTVSFTSTKYSINSMKLPVTNDWRPWSYFAEVTLAFCLFLFVLPIHEIRQTLAKLNDSISVTGWRLYRRVWGRPKFCDSEIGRSASSEGPAWQSICSDQALPWWHTSSCTGSKLKNIIDKVHKQFNILIFYVLCHLCCTLSN